MIFFSCFRGKFILSLAFSPDGQYLASGAIDGIINIFDMETKKVKHSLEEHAMPIRSIAFSPDSQKLLTGKNNFDKLVLISRQ